VSLVRFGLSSPRIYSVGFLTRFTSLLPNFQILLCISLVESDPLLEYPSNGLVSIQLISLASRDSMLTHLGGKLSQFPFN